MRDPMPYYSRSQAAQEQPTTLLIVSLQWVVFVGFTSQLRAFEDKIGTLVSIRPCSILA